MQKVTDFTSKEILQINVNNPEKLFSMDNIDIELKRLRKKWHPDFNDSPDAKDVFSHITQLNIAAKIRIKTDTWSGKATLLYTTSLGNTFKFKYKKCNEFELGKMYIGEQYVAYVISEKNQDLFNNGVKSINNINYPDAKMKSEFKKLMPSIKQTGKTNIGYVMIMPKPKNAVLLSDLLDFLPDNKIDPKHTAWITSSLYNIAMFLNHSGITHNSILPSTVFVDVDQHMCYLLGGWWYSVKADTKLIAMPSELTKTLPKEIISKKISSTIYDRQSIKALSVKCLGDKAGGSKLLFDKNIPKPFLNWVRTPSITSALDEYAGWIKALESSYGERKFVKFETDITNIY